MSEKSSSSILQTFLIGVIALLPLTLTVVAVIWTADLFQQFLGPDSLVGKLLTDLGLSFADSKLLAYLSGIVLILLIIFTLGVLLQRRLARNLMGFFGDIFRRIPVVGKIYDLAERLVGVFGVSDDPDMKNMTPAWCFFGGDGGTAVLALLPSSEPVTIDGHEYLAILVPSAPVPVGGGLLFVRKEWVKPADVGIESLTSIYVTMGVSAPAMLQEGAAAGKKAGAL